MRRSLICFSLCSIFGNSLFGQAARPSELTDQAVKQVINRILQYEIKPARTPRKVYLKGTSYLLRDKGTDLFQIPIQTDWLPSIKNIEFKLYAWEEDANVEGYDFDCIEKVKGRYEISVGFGSLGIGGGEGKIWSFNIERTRVRLWFSPNRGFGWANDAAS